MKRRKPRVPHIGLDFSGPTTVTGMQQNADGSITLFGPDGKPLPIQAAFAGLAYERAKGAKITYQIPDYGESVGSLESALSRFTRIFGIDTNSIEHNGEKVCVTAICELSNVVFEGPRWSGKVTSHWALEFRQPTKDPERIGWQHVIAHGQELGWLTDNSTALLVVDSHLGDLHRINQRQAPIIDNLFLPSGMSIAYASADTASDSILNGLISACDRVAGEVIDYVASNELPSLRVGQRTPFRSYRYWKFAET
jgi:hypothetical protein